VAQRQYSSAFFRLSHQLSLIASMQRLFFSKPSSQKPGVRQ
jgi:hypothetical protein